MGKAEELLEYLIGRTPKEQAEIVERCLSLTYNYGALSISKLMIENQLIDKKHLGRVEILHDDILKDTKHETKILMKETKNNDYEYDI